MFETFNVPAMYVAIQVRMQQNSSLQQNHVPAR